MRAVSRRAHRNLDYAVIVVFALAPVVLSLTGAAAGLSYALAAVHLLLTLVTAAPVGVMALVPIPLHGIIEFVVAVGLVVVGLAFDGSERAFYVIIGLVVFVVWFVTAYTEPRDAG